MARLTLPVSDRYLLRTKTYVARRPPDRVFQRIRVIAGEGAPPVIGTLIARRSDSLVVGREKDTIAVERNDLTRIDQSLGPRPAVSEGMFIGLLVGTSLGALAFAATFVAQLSVSFH